MLQAQRAPAQEKGFASADLKEKGKGIRIDLRSSLQ
jgi:hypothetical protein